MTDSKPLDLDALEKLCAKATKGPVCWFGNDHQMYLATINRGRQFVMTFSRWGMQGAQPRFRQNGRMVDASALVRFDVAPDVRGMTAGKASEKVYRYDFSEIDHPDAKYIEAAYNALPVALSEIRRLRALCEEKDAEIERLRKACADVSRALNGRVHSRDAMTAVSECARLASKGETG